MIVPNTPNITIGTVVAPFGIKGEVKIRVETDFPERFEDLDEIWLQPKNGEGRMVEIKSVRFHQGVYLMKFAGVNDRTGSEGLRGAELKIDESQLMELEEGEYYVHDLIGLDIYTTSGEHIGKIDDVLSGPANDVYVTKRGLIPVIKQVVKEINLEEHKVVIEPMEGMLEGE